MSESLIDIDGIIKEQEKKTAEIKANLDNNTQKAFSFKPFVETIISFVESQHDNNMMQMRIARDSRSNVSTLRNSLDPAATNSTLIEAARKRAEDLIEQKSSADLDIKNFGGFMATTTESDASRIAEESKSLYAKDLATSKTAVSKEDQDKFFKNMGFSVSNGSIVRECIPCGMRPLSSSDIYITGPNLKKSFQQIVDKYKALAKQLGSLSFNEFEQDLCDLLKFLDSQCMPDLFALLSLLGLMIAKYQDASLTSWRNVLNSLLAPLLSPIIAPLVVNLDKYINNIVDPLICVVNALELQLSKLDVVGGFNAAQEQRKKYNERKIEFYERKKRSLQTRYNQIQKEKETDTTKKTFPQYKTKNPFTGKDVDLEAVNVIPKSQRRTYKEEMDQIGKEINDCDRKIADLKNKNAGMAVTESKYVDKAYTSLNDAREKLKDTKEYLKAMISGLVGVTNQGIEMVRTTLEMYRTELERMILGRVSNQEDQIELARSIQKLQRYISIINALMKLKKKQNLLDRCNKEGGDGSAMGDFVSAFKSEPDGDNYTFYQAKDSAGNDVMVIAPGGANLTVTGIEFDDLGTDELLNDATINEVQTSATFNDLNEADEMNKKGLLIDIGNITGKDITVELKDAGNKKTSLDYKAESSYVIIKNDFCSKSPNSFGSSELVKTWAKML